MAVYESVCIWNHIKVLCVCVGGCVGVWVYVQVVRVRAYYETKCLQRMWMKESRTRNSRRIQKVKSTGGK